MSARFAQDGFHRVSNIVTAINKLAPLETHNHGHPNGHLHFHCKKKAQSSIPHGSLRPHSPRPHSPRSHEIAAQGSIVTLKPAVCVICSKDFRHQSVHLLLNDHCDHDICKGCYDLHYRDGHNVCGALHCPEVLHPEVFKENIHVLDDGGWSVQTRQYNPEEPQAQAPAVPCEAEYQLQHTATLLPPAPAVPCGESCQLQHTITLPIIPPLQSHAGLAPHASWLGGDGHTYSEAIARDPFERRFSVE